MSIKDLITRSKSGNFSKLTDDYSLYSFQREINKLFDDFFDIFPSSFTNRQQTRKKNQLYPEIDIKETDKLIFISAELPGIEKEDLEVLVSSDSLTIKGEKKKEREEKGQNYCRSERQYGFFSRVIPLTSEADTAKVEAKFRNGILDIIIPKTEKAKSAFKKVTIQKNN